MLACLFSVRDQLDGKTKERCGLGRIYRGGNFFNYFNDSLAQGNVTRGLLRERNFLSEPFDG